MFAVWRFFVGAIVQITIAIVGSLHVTITIVGSHNIARHNVDRWKSYFCLRTSCILLVLCVCVSGSDTCPRWRGVVLPIPHEEPPFG